MQNSLFMVAAQRTTLPLILYYYVRLSPVFLAAIPLILLETAQAGQSLDLGRGARLEVLATTPKGAVLLLRWVRFRAVLPVGQDFERLEALQADQSLVGITALILADGGWSSLNPPEWIRRLQPQVILISGAPGDGLGCPIPEVLAGLDGFTILRTDRNGWIDLSMDGKQLWVDGGKVIIIHKA